MGIDSPCLLADRSWPKESLKTPEPGRSKSGKTLEISIGLKTFPPRMIIGRSAGGNWHQTSPYTSNFTVGLVFGKIFSIAAAPGWLGRFMP